MGDYEKQHYVPVFLLKRWIGVDGRVCQYYRPYAETVVRRIVPASTGFEHNLTTLHSLVQSNQQDIEKMFGEVDREASKVVNILGAGQVGSLTPKQRAAWVIFILSLILRNPETVENARRQGAEILRRDLERDPEEYEAANGNLPEASLLELVQNRNPEVFGDIGVGVFPQVLLDAKTGGALWNMYWFVMDTANCPHSVLIGDRPIATTHGLGNPLCLVACPIGPRHIFFATSNKATIRKIGKMRPKDIVSSINAEMAGSATKYVWGQENSQLRFVERRLRKKEDVAPLQRPA